jgi:FAD/FMN-containing dehydrogenase
LADRRIQFERRVGRIGFMGKGAPLPGRRAESDAPHSIALRIGDDRVLTSQDQIRAARLGPAPIPGLLAGLFTRTPEAVVRPASAREAAEVLSICFEERTGVVPRGRATAGLGGAVPVRGGVVVDSQGLNRIVDLDRASGTATVEAGVVWDELTDALAKEDYAPLAFPSSGAGSTVGGWASTGGYGIGTQRHGRFSDLIVSLEAALPSGFLVEATGSEGRYSIPTFAGTEGQVGIVTRVTMKVGRVPEKRAAYLVPLPGFEAGLPVFEGLASMEQAPMSVEVVNRAASRLYGPGRDADFLLATYEGATKEVEAFTHALQRLLTAGLEADASVDVRRLREARFTSEKTAAGEGSLYSGALLFDGNGLRRFLAYALERGRRDESMTIECLAVARGRFLARVGFPAGPDGTARAGAFWRLRNAVAQGARMGGVPYGAGLWNSPYIDVIVGDRKKELRRIKDEVDRLHAMNPGKFFSMTTSSGLPVPAWLMRALFGRMGRA